MIFLLDGNVLIALGDADHIHHGAAQRWFSQIQEREFATCPITQGTLLRMLMLNHVVDEIDEAVEILAGFLAHSGHTFWPDDAGYPNISLRGVIGHRQITDAYLAAMARRRGSRLATLDRGLAALHHDVAELIPT